MMSGETRMKIPTAAILTWMAFTGAVYAQAPAPAAPASKGYVEGVAQSAFGNVTSQSFGAEFGYAVMPALQVFVDAGYTGNTTPKELGTAAQSIAGWMSQTQSNVTYVAKQPVSFGVGGVRYRFRSSAKVEPYVLGGVGAAQVKKDVTFSISGADVTATLPQYGVVLGSDLSGSETKAMLEFGGGVVWPAWKRLIVDFQYRYGYVFATGQGLNINRAGVGIGFRF
jgi:opacity protein-like surface antigen